MRYCSEDASRTGERNVNFNETTSENAVLNKKDIVDGKIRSRGLYLAHNQDLTKRKFFKPEVKMFEL